MRTLKRFSIIAALLLGSSYISLAQTKGTNYLKVQMPQIPVTDTSKLDTIPIQRKAVNIQYTDGLGRNLQAIQMGGSVNLNDVIVPSAYDNMGRQVKIYLPYADQSTSPTTSGTYRSNAITNAVNFYSPTAPGAPKIPTDTSPFAQTVYESSPLGRVNEQGEVGAVTQPGTGHSVRVSYQVNSAADSIADYPTANTLGYGYYAAGTLTKTIVTDQNGHRQAVWKDRQGRMLTRTQLDAPTAYYSTDYIYNDLGQLAIIAPAIHKKTYIDDPSYYFNYDSLGRVVEKKEPQKGWVYTIYNHGDQPVLSQDSNMRARHQWVYMKYDAEGRMVQTGIYTNATILTRRAMQVFCDGFATLWETWQPGVGYTNNAFPTSLTIRYTQFYYDDYTFPEATAKPFLTNTYGTTPTQRTMGMLTGSTVYVLGSDSLWLATVNYYDKQNRLIQQIGDNHLGRVDVVNNRYNFTGQLMASERIIRPLQDTVVDIKDRYVYDHLNRLMDTYESFRGAAEVDISHNVYNEISQKVTEGLHATTTVPPNSAPAYAAVITENTTLTAGRQDIATDSVLLKPDFSFTATDTSSYLAAIGHIFAQTQEFRYNIKGWLTSINNGTLTPDGGITQSDPNALFGESITYYESSPLSGTVAQYNGNISGMTWRNKIEASGKPGITTGGQGYKIGYDAVYRLTQDGYYTQTGGSFTPSPNNANTETLSDYDELGNIGRLDRTNNSGSIINSLHYSYARLASQLTSVLDNGSAPITGTFTYDGNGNMITDSHKGITLHYNYLDLVDTVTKGSSKLVFTYDAAGNKLYKQLLVGGTVVSQRHYVEDLEMIATNSVAADGKIESIAMAEGRVVNTGAQGYKYEYYLQDHLFNNRVNFRVEHSGTANLSQVQNYYPFGETMGDSTMNYTTTPVDYYRYSGKELQPELDLNTYDFGARHYNPVLARWMVMDPLAVDFDDQSPYSYVGNNPLNFIDPDGMQYNGNAISPGQMASADINIHSGTGGGASGIPWSAIGALPETYNAFKAFQPSHTTFENFSTVNKLQGNVIHTSQTVPQYGVQKIVGTHTNMRAGLTIAIATAESEGFANPYADAIVGGIAISIPIVETAEKVRDDLPRGVQYTLRATAPGYYDTDDYPENGFPVMKRGYSSPVGYKPLKPGDIWKIGETTQYNPATRKQWRYPRSWLEKRHLKFFPEVEGTKPVIFRIQVEKIMQYLIETGELPPGNKIKS